MNNNNFPGQFNEEEKKEDLFEYFWHQPGTIPGTLSIEINAKPPEIILIDYNANRVDKFTEITPEECSNYLDSESVSWVDVSGLGNEDILKRLGKVFSLHPLILEDIVNVPQRPKIEDYHEQLVIITQMAIAKENGQGFWLEQVSFVLGKHYLLTVQEEGLKDCFDSVRKRLKNNKGIIRECGADYLAYALWDAIIDGFFPVLESYGERIEQLEDEVVINPSKKTLAKIYKIKRELLALRRAIWPQRDAINSLIRDGNPLISPQVFLYLRDCYDHIVQIIDVVETYRELASSLTDVYLSAVSNKMNEIMKLLTVISSIFIPLTYVAGVYGMNFDTEVSPWNMPELKWYFGYPFYWTITLTIAISLIFFFWRRGWFEDFSPSIKTKSKKFKTKP